MKKIILVILVIICLTGCFNKENTKNNSNSNNESNIVSNDNNLDKVKEVQKDSKYKKGYEQDDKYDNLKIKYTKYSNPEDTSGFATIVVSDMDDIWGYVTESSFAGQNENDEYIGVIKDKMFIQNKWNLIILDVKTGIELAKYEKFGYGEVLVYSDDDYIIFGTSTHTHVVDSSTDIVILDNKTSKILKTISAKEDVDIHTKSKKEIVFTYKMNFANGESEKEEIYNVEELISDNFTTELADIK